MSLNPRSWRGVLDTTLCDKVCQWLATGQWFPLGTSVCSINKTDRHDITEILLKVTLNTINHHTQYHINTCKISLLFRCWRIKEYSCITLPKHILVMGRTVQSEKLLHSLVILSTRVEWTSGGRYLSMTSESVKIFSRPSKDEFWKKYIIKNHDYSRKMENY